MSTVYINGSSDWDRTKESDLANQIHTDIRIDCLLFKCTGCCCWDPDPELRGFLEKDRISTVRSSQLTNEGLHSKSCRVKIDTRLSGSDNLLLFPHPIVFYAWSKLLNDACYLSWTRMVAKTTRRHRKNYVDNGTRIFITLHCYWYCTRRYHKSLSIQQVLNFSMKGSRLQVALYYANQLAVFSPVTFLTVSCIYNWNPSYSNQEIYPKKWVFGSSLVVLCNSENVGAILPLLLRNVNYVGIYLVGETGVICHTG